MSVVIPTYNRPDYLRIALASAVAQTYTNLEILVCDDGSSDANRAVTLEFDDPRISYIRNPRRLGIGGNKFAGWKRAQGKYLANLDDDDVWTPSFVDRIVKPLESDARLVLAYCNHFVINEAGAIDCRRTVDLEQRYRAGVTPGRQDDFSYLALVQRAVPTTMASVMRREAIEWDDPPPDTDITADLWLAYLIWRSGGAAYFDPERLTKYRVHSRSATAAGGSQWHRAYVGVYERFCQDEGLRPLWPAIEAECAVTHARLALAYASEGRRSVARQEALAAIHKGNHIRGVVALGLALEPTGIARILLKRRNAR